jgi:hypothetical protein
MKSPKSFCRVGCVLIAASLISVHIISAYCQAAPPSPGAGEKSPHPGHKGSVSAKNLKFKPFAGHQLVDFDLLSGFDLRVDWVLNPTNSAMDSLRVEGEIPARIRSLDGKKISIAGYVKAIKQDQGGVTEFLLVRDYFTCCEGTKPKVNEMIHVILTAPLAGVAAEKPVALRGALRVGAKLTGSNVVSVYRMEQTELETIVQDK